MQTSTSWITTIHMCVNLNIRQKTFTPITMHTSNVLVSHRSQHEYLHTHKHTHRIDNTHTRTHTHVHSHGTSAPKTSIIHTNAHTHTNTHTHTQTHAQTHTHTHSEPKNPLLKQYYKSHAHEDRKRTQTYNVISILQIRIAI